MVKPSFISLLILVTCVLVALEQDVVLHVPEDFATRHVATRIAGVDVVDIGCAVGIIANVLQRGWGHRRNVGTRVVDHVVIALVVAAKLLGPVVPVRNQMSLRATRNYYGSQRESFKAEVSVEAEVAQGEPIEADFIRAPLLAALSETVCVLARAGDRPVLFREGQLLASSFHTELGTDTRLHEYFLRLA